MQQMQSTCTLPTRDFLGTAYGLFDMSDNASERLGIKVIVHR